MFTKIINISVSVFLLLHLLTGALAFSHPSNNPSYSFQVCPQDNRPEVKPHKVSDKHDSKDHDSDHCNNNNNNDKGHCNPLLPKCPLCPTANSANLYLIQGAEAYLPPLISFFISIPVAPLSDQGVVKSIFHPPTALL